MQTKSFKNCFTFTPSLSNHTQCLKDTMQWEKTNENYAFDSLATKYLAVIDLKGANE